MIFYNVKGLNTDSVCVCVWKVAQRGAPEKVEQMQEKGGTEGCGLQNGYVVGVDVVR